MQGYKFSPPITVTQAFDLTTDALWELVSAPGNLNDAHPFCKTNEALTWDGNEHVDRLVYLNGRTYVRRFQTWNPGEGYTLLIGADAFRQSFVEWTIKPLETGGSSLTIAVRPYLLANWPRLLFYLVGIEVYDFWIVPRMQRYLRSVLGGFAHVATTGEPVPRNHFGRHPWFS